MKTEGKCGFHYEAVFMAIFMICFCSYVLFTTYSDQEYKQAIFKENTYVFSEYQLKNGVHLSYVDDTDKYSHVVLHLANNDIHKILLVKNEFLEYPNGPLSQLSKSFSAQQYHYAHKKDFPAKKWTKSDKKAIIPPDSLLPSLKKK